MEVGLVDQDVFSTIRIADEKDMNYFKHSFLYITATNIVIFTII